MRNFMESVVRIVDTSIQINENSELTMWSNEK